MNIFRSYKILNIRVYFAFMLITLIYNKGFSMGEYNKIIIDTITDNKMLIGEINLNDFNNSPFKEWFELEYNYYKPDKATISQLKNKITGIKILIFLGTWCPDSRIDVPRFIKILDEIDFEKNNLKIIAVDRKKKDPYNLSINYNIEYVPTFIFFKENVELGRIVESPKTSLEADMIEILSK
jgi:thiol-disulfide isomerase/thioredoxin